MAELLLRPLTLADEPEALAAHAELAPDDFTFLLDWEPALSWAAYLARLEAMQEGRGLRPDQVPSTFLVGVAAGRIVGRLSLRHELNAFLEETGGHIGFGVRPADRHHGHATAMLRAALPLAAAVGVERALVTCDEGNVGSARTIEACGGRFERAERGVRRYWAATT